MNDQQRELQMYVHKPMVKFSGASQKCVSFVFQLKKKVNGYRQNNSEDFQNSQNPLLRIVFVTIYQNYKIGIKAIV